MSSNRNKAIVQQAIAQEPRPTLVIVVAAWALFQVVRVPAFSLAQDVLSGVESPAWLFPAFGDIFIGITAPLVAFLVLRRTGLGVWVTAIVWFALSIMDRMDGLTSALTVALPRALPITTRSAALPFFLGVSAFHAIALVLLARSGVRSYYLSPLGRVAAG